MDISLQLYSVKDQFAADPEGTLKVLAEMGYDGVEFAGLFHYDPAEIKALCAEIGLVPISAHVPIAEMLEDAERKTFEAELTVIPTGTEGKYEFEYGRDFLNAITGGMIDLIAEAFDLEVAE